MPVNATDPKADPREPVAFRLRKAHRLMLVAIGHERGHANMNATLEDAVAAYIDSYLREKIAA